MISDFRNQPKDPHINIDSHAEKNRYTYATREAQPDWVSATRSIVYPDGKYLVDIGCGGGIYSTALANICAVEITGVDFSEQMVLTAAETNAARVGVTFRQGAHTGLPIVFERALIYHLKDYGDCCREAHRILVSRGDYIIQDRTPDDVLAPGSPEYMCNF